MTIQKDEKSRGPAFWGTCTFPEVYYFEPYHQSFRVPAQAI